MTAQPFSGVASVHIGVDGELEPLGTAFLISPRYVLTAFHVVDGIGGEVVLRFGKAGRTTDICAREVRELRDEVHDAAILRCEEAPPSDAVPIELGNPDRSSTAWQSKGFPNIRRDDGFTIAGEIRDRHATDGRVRAIQLYASELIGGECAGGFSGAPCVVDGRAIGFIRSALSRFKGKTSAGTVYATSIADISRALLPRLSGKQSGELLELRARLNRVRASRLAARVKRVALIASILSFSVFIGANRLQLRFVDQRFQPQERVEVELRDCLRGAVSGISDELGELQLTIFRLCPSHEIVLKNSRRAHGKKLSVNSLDFLISRKIACTITERTEIDCE